MTLRSVLHVGFGTSAIVLAAGNAWAQPQTGHGDPLAPLVLSLAVLLIILAVVTGAIAAAGEGGAFSIGAVGWVAAKATVFLVGALWLGVSLAPRVFALAATLRTGGVLLSIGLCFCFLLAWLADRIELAPIVGASRPGSSSKTCTIAISSIAVSARSRISCAP